MSELATRCSVCRGLLDEEDLFCPDCGTEAPRGEKPAADQAPAAQLATHNFECSGCGASMSYDASAGSLRCPFCGSVDLVQKPDAKMIAPSRVVPFVLDRDQAVETMRRWLGRGFWRPGDLSTQAMVVSMTAVYVPYWVFAAETHTYWTADTSRTPPGASGDWYPLAGEHSGQYAGLLVGASSVLSAWETSQICPFDLAAGVDPAKVDLENVIYERFAVPRKYARPLAQQGLESLEAEACQAAYVPDQCRNMKVNVQVTGLTSEPVLLPVWIMAYRYKETVFRFLVNGQSGRSTGQAPTSWLKVLAASALAAAIAILLFLLGLAMFAH
ncbi:MAG: TFIIB-type zinc ribbon-containing protein [Pirellulales bacterium]